MIATPHRRLPIATPEDLRLAQAELAQLAARLELSAEDAARADALLTCVAGDLLRSPQSRSGILLRALPAAAPQTAGLEMIGLNAVGHADPAAASGAAAIAWSALADVFDTYLRGPRSTVLLVRVYGGRRTPFPDTLRIGGIAVGADPRGPHGSGWAWRRDPPGTTLLLVDYAALGAAGHPALLAGLTAFDRGAARVELARSLEEIHWQLPGPAGAAAGICRIDRDRHSLQYLTVGGIRGRFIAASPEDCVELAAMPGRLGATTEVPLLDVHDHPWPAEACLVLGPGGLLSRIDAGRYPGLLRRDPTLIAALLHADHRPDDGDATVVVVQNQTVATA